MGVRLGNGNWAVKTSKLLAYNDASGMFFNKEFDFTRATTATRVNKSGLIESVASNLPRIDFLNDTKGHLLLEPASTNRLTYSEDFTQSIWTNARSSGATNQITAPDGTTTGYKLTDSTDNNTHLLFSNQTVTTSDVFAFSMFLKKGSLDNGFIAFDSNINQSVVFNLQNGTIVSTGSGITSSKIENFGNDWFRCSFTHTPTSTTRNYRVGTYNGSISYAGTGNDFIYCWGAQLEQQSFATSYIPTSGSSVTRNADVCNNSGAAQDFDSTEGVLYVEIAALANDGTTRALSLSDGSSSDRVFINYSSTNNRLSCFGSTGSSTQFSMGSDITDATDFIKVALKYKLNDIALFINGSEVNTDTSATLPSADTFTSLQLDSGGGASDFYGKVREVRTYRTALTDSELTALTT